jgi:hypothetical protein
MRVIEEMLYKYNRGYAQPIDKIIFTKEEFNHYPEFDGIIKPYKYYYYDPSNKHYNLQSFFYMKKYGKPYPDNFPYENLYATVTFNYYGPHIYYKLLPRNDI